MHTRNYEQCLQVSARFCWFRVTTRVSLSRGYLFSACFRQFQRNRLPGKTRPRNVLSSTPLKLHLLAHSLPPESLICKREGVATLPETPSPHVRPWALVFLPSLLPRCHLLPRVPVFTCYSVQYTKPRCKVVNQPCTVSLASSFTMVRIPCYSDFHEFLNR